MEPKEITKGAWAVANTNYTLIGKVIDTQHSPTSLEKIVYIKVTYPEWWKGTRNCENMVQAFNAEHVKLIEPNDYYFIP